MGERQWVTYYGGTDSDFGWAMALGDNGGLYLTGYTRGELPFPSPNPNNTFEQPGLNSTIDSYIVAFNPNGRQVWGTLLGGDRDDFGSSLATDGNSQIYVAGRTLSTSNFPLDDGEGIPYFQDVTGGSTDGFITRFDLTQVIIASIEEPLAEAQSVSVYPNPSSGLFNIVMHDIGDEVQLEVFTVPSMRVISERIKCNHSVTTMQLDLSDRPSGVYLLSVMDMDGQNRATAKLINQK